MSDSEFDHIDCDDLSAARGILLGMFIGLCLWVALGVSIWLW